jgi:CBS-domain-containing membrane protein
VVFAKQLSGMLPFLVPVGKIAWPWYVLIGTTITLLVGIVSSYIGAPSSARPVTRPYGKAA